MSKIFNHVAGNHPALNRFDLSYTDVLSAKIGLLYPVQTDEVYPGDVFKMSCFCHCEVQPMVAPLMSDLTIFAHTFFVPYRILYGVDGDDGHSIWEKFITGDKDGDYDTPLTGWSPEWDVTTFSSYKIWDFVGNPVSYTLDNDDHKYHWKPIVPRVLSVSAAPKLAYNKIWNDYYRDENLQDEMTDLFDNEDLLAVSFKKDYFTSALNQQQRGISPGIPVTGSIPIQINGAGFTPLVFNPDAEVVGSKFYKTDNFAGGLPVNGFYYLNGSGTQLFESDGTYHDVVQGQKLNQLGVNNIFSATGTATGNLSAVNINQLRLMFAQQRLLELNETGGYRYTEWLGSHYGTNPTDARLDRPEYIGGCMIPINISPTVQNGETGTTPQGNKAGIGSADSIQKIGNYRVLEHGLIMTLISVRPKPIYQQGINRQWLRQTRYDYYIPEMAYLSEQGVFNAELYVSGNDNSVIGDEQIFGYQACWNEMRCKNNMVAGPVREQFDYWTMARKFANRPALNEDFIKIVDSDFNRVFAVQDEDEFIISWSNLIDAYRPIPAMGVPGLVDHVYGGR